MLKILPLGGMGNVTKNMFAYDTGDAILLVDCGIGFPDENMPGVDLLIPDTTWLEDKKDRIMGMILTHGHDDHIAGLPYILPRIGGGFPIYGSPLTLSFARSRLKDFRVNADFRTLNDAQPLTIGPFIIHSIPMTHSVPDTRHYMIETGNLRVYHGADFKIDLTPVDGVKPDLMSIAAFGSRGIDLLLSDCLRSEKEGFSLSESTLTDSFEREIRGTRGKFIVTTMSSNVHRIQQAVNVAAAHNRKIAFIGRSVEQNMRDAQGLHMVKLPKNAIVDKRTIRSIPANHLCLIIAGAQGQPGSSLVRAATEEHDLINLQPGDKVVFSADAIPGNEASVYATIDTLSRLGVDVVYPEVSDSLHVSGHASAGEQMLLMALTKPRFLMPIGGTYRHMIQYRKLGREMGYKDQQVFLLDTGQTLVLESREHARVGETIPLKNIMVDGLGVGDVGTVVLRDRQSMAKDGVVIVIIPLEQETGNVAGAIEVVSRGFVYVKESKPLIDGSVEVVKRTLSRIPKKNWSGVKEAVANALEDYFYSETKRLPMILPVVIEV